MTAKRLVDTNIIIRYLAQDHPQHTEAVNRLIERCIRGELVLSVVQAVLAESVFVLNSFYKFPRDRISRLLAVFLTSPGVEMIDSSIHLDALDRYGKTKAHFVDCLLAATAVACGCNVASFDADLARFADVKVRND